MMKKLLAALLAVCLLVTLCPAALAAQTDDLSGAIAGAQKYLLDSLPRGTTGGAADSIVFALVRSNAALPTDYTLQYAQSVAAELLENGGALALQRGGEMGRAVLALTAMGYDPSNLCGQNLLPALADYDTTVRYGISGAITVLRALDSRGYTIPKADVSTQATRALYLNSILNVQLPDGGWTHSGGKANAELTANVLQVLANYRDQSAVENAIDLALTRLSELQQDDGGFTTWSTPSAEPTAQVVLALCALGIPLDDARFTKNGATALDKLLTYQDASGGFRSTTTPHITATYQALEALCAVQRSRAGSTPLFDLSDVVMTQPETRSTDAKPLTLQKPGAVFSDTERHENRDAISILGAYGVISGVGNGRFSPDSTMTRAQFAKIVVCALGLEAAYRGTFTDVAEDAWYAPYVDTAAAYGIARGVGGGLFKPESTITRQEAAVMLTRAAALCGFDTQSADTSNVDAAVAGWAQSAMAFCAAQALFPTALQTQPMREILRCEIAQTLCNLLMQTNLLQ